MNSGCTVTACQSASNRDPLLECAPAGGQDPAAFIDHGAGMAVFELGGAEIP